MLDSGESAGFVEGHGLQSVNSFLNGASLRACYSQASQFIRGNLRRGQLVDAAFARPGSTEQRVMRVCANLPPAGRDVRLDLVRGPANWAIFLDHILRGVELDHDQELRLQRCGGFILFSYPAIRPPSCSEG
jgi:hypothetical protein